MALTANRWVQRSRGALRQAPQLPSVSAHTASMFAQASRVPRLANITIASSAIKGGRVSTSKKAR